MPGPGTMHPWRRLLVSAMLCLLLGAPVVLVVHGWLARPDIQARYTQASVRIVDHFLTEYRLGMQSATLADPQTGRVLVRVSCPTGRVFTALELRFGTRRMQLDPHSACRVHARLPSGFAFRRDQPLRVTVTGNNGYGVMRRATRMLASRAAHPVRGPVVPTPALPAGRRPAA